MFICCFKHNKSSPLSFLFIHYCTHTTGAVKLIFKIMFLPTSYSHSPPMSCVYTTILNLNHKLPPSFENQVLVPALSHARTQPRIFKYECCRNEVVGHSVNYVNI